ncbi:MAG: hemerythrin domain-containing protein [Acidimicrobiales bacterium]
MDVLEHLEEEHRKVEKMIAELEATETAAEREPILAELGDALAKHMDVEQERVYPIVAERLGDDVSQHANDDHDKARDDLVRLVEQSDQFEFTSALAQFKDDLAQHVSEEENYIFPNLRANAAYDIADLGDPHKLEDEVQQELIEENIDLIDERLAQ